uniref:Uncharacterized protein n=1 Tax=Tetranychus urticae TaxID=32264 RepID=T1JSM1_TETUR
MGMHEKDDEHDDNGDDYNGE